MAATRDVAGRRYALAVMDIAREERAVESWAAAVEALESLTSEPRFVEALQADGMTDERLIAIVRRVLPEATPKQLNLFRLLRRKSRLSLGPSIASFFRDLMDEEQGLARAVVTTAVPLDGARQESIRQSLEQRTGRRIVMESRVDPEIGGGMVVRIGDRLVDGSTRTRLRSLRGALERAAL
jgi:F-type H+-transporting ATPase subunit delta